MTSHTDHDDLTWEENVGGNGDIMLASVTLNIYDTAWMPGSTERVYHGPLVVAYTKYADGGIDAVSFPRQDLSGESYPTT